MVMGEVGNTIAEDQPAPPKKQNGELNGNHAPALDDEQMEIDETKTSAAPATTGEVKKISLDGDSNEPAVVPAARETNGKSKDDSDVMEIDDNGSQSDADPLATTAGDTKTQSDKDESVAVPKEIARNRNSNNSESAVVLSSSSDDEDGGT